MQVALVLLLAFSSFDFFADSALLRNVDDDTVVIHASEHVDKLLRQKRQFVIPGTLPAQVIDGSLEGSPCDSLPNEHGVVGRGTCSKVSDCYPLIWSSEGEESRDPGLVDVFKAHSGICAPVSTTNHVLLTLGYHTAAADPNELICCTSGQQSKSPSPKPSAPSTFVVGGTPADITKFPWAVSMFIRGRHSCGGSLITKNTVLTAAHCVKDLGPNDIATMKLYLGHHDISQTSVPRGLLEARTATKVLYHKGFSMRTLQDDIALIILNSAASADSNPKISPVSLVGTTSSDTMATVAGWGQTFWGSSTSTRLLEATMDVWPHLKCVQKYSSFQPPVNISPLKQVCTGSPGKDSCRGDSGGPLHVKRGEAFQQIGIVSFGGKCGEFPGVYTRVAAYSDWIQKNKKD